VHVQVQPAAAAMPNNSLQNLQHLQHLRHHTVILSQQIQQVRLYTRDRIAQGDRESNEF
jgi:hypothetical protein